MELKKSKSYKLLYLMNLVLLGIAGILAFTPTSQATFAEDGPIGLTSGAHFITINDQGDSLTIKTDAMTVGEALERANITLDEYDLTEPSINTTISSDNFNVNIYRARPVLVEDGTTTRFLYSASRDAVTVAKEAGFKIYDGDTVTISQNNQFLEAGATTAYKVIRSGGNAATIETRIPFTEETVDDPDLEIGQTKVKQVGEDGLRVARYSVRLENGIEVSRTLVSDTVEKEPVPRITAVGTKEPEPEVAPAEEEADVPDVAMLTRPERAVCESWARQAGVSEANMKYAMNLIYKESGCRTGATNSYSGAYGIPQALPAEKMASAGSDWKTNPVTQIKWMNKYVSRYGGWAGAWKFWQENHWY